ncbi:MAG: hypothetical protein IPJ50_16475 [Betaproteobacteria bacterium]|nr:hypothetical protein [Betaproteobacteria bacterium]
MVSAEAVLGQQLGGALTRRLDLATPVNSAAARFSLNDSATAKPAGFIVVGLGQVGGLSPGLARRLGAFGPAQLLHIEVAHHWPDKRFGDLGRPRPPPSPACWSGPALAACRLATPSEPSCAPLSTNRRLAEQGLDNRVLIDRMEFLELSEDVAIAAADALGRVLQNDALSNAIRWPAKSVETGARRAADGCASGRRSFGISALKSLKKTVACASFSRLTGRAPKKRWPPANSRWRKVSSRSPAATPGKTRQRPAFFI